MSDARLQERDGASPVVIALVQRNGVDWYANEVVAPLLGYDFQGEVDARECVRRHMAGFPEPLRSECRAAVEALAEYRATKGEGQ